MGYKENFKFIFSMPTRIIYGDGRAKTVGGELAALGVKRALLVTDTTISGFPMVENVKDAMGDALAAVYDKVTPDTGIELVNEAARMARENGATGVVSVGGGASIDTAKGAAVLLSKNSDDIRDWVGLFKVGAPAAPHVAIPTTAGTGSEVTSMAVIKDREKNVKGIVVDPHIIPQVGILDPKMTVGMPPMVTASTGMDALTHAIEAIHSTNFNPLSDAMALWAIATISGYLPRCVENGGDADARGMQLLASNAAGIAFQNALVGVVHAMAHSAGGLYGVPHGTANSIFLPHGMRFNLKASARRYAMVATAMGSPIRSESEERAARKAVSGVVALTEKLGMPQRLRDVGVPEEGIEKIAQLTLADPAIFTNPVKPEGVEQIVEIVRAAW